MEEPIHIFPIHNLPENLILECLARLHIKDLPIASQVCRKWLHVVGSRHFYSFRKQLGYTNKVACLLQHIPSTFGFSKCAINMFDPMNREWNRLPPIPNSWSNSIASSEGKLVVFSNCDPSSRGTVRRRRRREPVKCVFVLDFVTQRWRKGTDMPLIKSGKFSTATSQCHRVFISGDLGREKGAVWEYDVWKDEWTVFHRVKGGQILLLKVIGEELWVIIGCKDIKKFRMFEENGADVYHLQTGKWRRVELGLGGVNDFLYLPAHCDCELMKNLVENIEFNGNVLYDCCRFQLSKQSLLKAPTATLNGHEELLFLQKQNDNFKRMHSRSLYSGSYGYLVSCCTQCCCLEL